MVHLDPIIIDAEVTNLDDYPEIFTKEKRNTYFKNELTGREFQPGAGFFIKDFTVAELSLLKRRDKLLGINLGDQKRLVKGKRPSWFDG